MSKIKLALIVALLAWGSVACGMSEGQLVGLYVSQMTVYERRVEADAQDLERLSASVNAQMSAQEREELVKVLQAQVQRFQETLKIVQESQAHKECESLKQQYELAFQARVEQSQLFLTYLRDKWQPQGQLDPNVVNEFVRASQELEEKTMQSEERIRQDKIVLARQYKEVQVPEVVND